MSFKIQDCNGCLNLFSNKSGYWSALSSSGLFEGDLKKIAQKQGIKPWIIDRLLVTLKTQPYEVICQGDQKYKVREIELKEDSEATS